MSANGTVARLPFLGQRTYLQGTTLFNHLITLVPEARSIDFRLHTIIASDTVRVDEIGPEAVSPGTYAAVLSCDVDGENRRLGVAPLPASATIDRVPFDESLITTPARFDLQLAQVQLQQPVPFPFVTRIVSLHKALLLKAMDCPKQGQWLFTRLELEQLPAKYDSLALVKRSNLGLKLVRSEIQVDGRPVGSVYFSWWTP